jgi:hypothetical protein
MITVEPARAAALDSRKNGASALGRINYGSRWFGPVVIGSRDGWEWTRTTWAA